MNNPSSPPVWELITPELAADYLARVRIQRRLKRTVVLAYAADMTAGRWEEDTNAIVFDQDGNLVNGQHRLWAVVESGKTVGFWVRRGVPAGAILRMDQGAQRTAADQLSIHGVVNVNHTAAAARAVLCYEAIPHLVWTTSAVAPVAPKSAVVDEVLKYQDLYASFYNDADHISKGGPGRSAGMALAVLVDRHSPSTDAWPAFVEGVHTGADLGINDARLALRKYHTRADKPTKWGGIQSGLLLCLTAWNRYVDGEACTYLRRPKRDQLPMPKPR